jgi:hypothetical protein
MNKNNSYDESIKIVEKVFNDINSTKVYNKLIPNISNIHFIENKTYNKDLFHQFKPLDTLLIYPSINILRPLFVKLGFRSMKIAFIYSISLLLCLYYIYNNNNNDILTTTSQQAESNENTIWLLLYLTIFIGSLDKPILNNLSISIKLLAFIIYLIYLKSSIFDDNNSVYNLIFMLIILLILNYNIKKLNKSTTLNVINIIIFIILLYCYYILQCKNTSNYNLDVFMKK